MSKLLIAESPLQVLPTLAKLIGLNEAIVLQQIHYESLRSRDDGWVDKPIADWHREDFAFWSIDTVKRSFAGLRSKTLLETQVVATSEGRAARVRVDHAALDLLAGGSVQSAPTPSGQDAPTGQGNVHRPRTNKGKEKTEETPIPPQSNVVKFRGRKVPLDVYCTGIALLESFNAKARTGYQPLTGAGAPSENLKRIFGAIIDHPEISLEIGERMIGLAFAKPFWQGTPQTGVVFGPGVCEGHLEAAMHAATRPASGQSLIERLDARRAA